MRQVDEAETLEELGARVSNWGRWGAEDERGAVNSIDRGAVLAAAGLIRKGAVFSLAIPFGAGGPQGTWAPASPRCNPIHLMTSTGNEPTTEGVTGARFADDAVFMPTQSATQWDSPGHAHYGGSLYNGWDSSSITVQGLERNSIARVSDGVIGRGILLDIPRLTEREALDPAEVVEAEHLDTALHRFGIETRSGDIVLVRTGWWGLYDSGRVTREAFMASEPGLGLSALAWLKEHDVAAVAVDNFGVEVQPSERPGQVFPFHAVAIRDMGLLLGELFALDELAADCLEDGCYEFMVAAPPLPIVGGAASPVNPLAVK